MPLNLCHSGNWRRDIYSGFVKMETGVDDGDDAHSEGR